MHISCDSVKTFQCSWFTFAFGWKSRREGCQLALSVSIDAFLMDFWRPLHGGKSRLTFGQNGFHIIWKILHLFVATHLWTWLASFLVMLLSSSSCSKSFVLKRFPCLLKISIPFSHFCLPAGWNRKKWTFLALTYNFRQSMSKCLGALALGWVPPTFGNCSAEHFITIDDDRFAGETFFHSKWATAVRILQHVACKLCKTFGI